MITIKLTAEQWMAVSLALHALVFMHHEDCETPNECAANAALAIASLSTICNVQQVRDLAKTIGDIASAHLSDSH